MIFPSPPDGSKIRIEDAFSGHRIEIPKQNWNFSRVFEVIFMVFWLCGWAVGEYFAIFALIDSKGNTPWFAKIFLMAWLGGWTVGGVAAIVQLYRCLRAGPAEILQLEDFQLTHKLLRSKTYQKDKISTPKLERNDNDLLLYFDHGKDRIFLGKTLSEPEREWLHRLISDWKSDSIALR